MEAVTSAVKEEKDEEKEEDVNVDVDQDLSLPLINEVEVRHATALLQRAGELPLDVARTVLAAHFRTLRATQASGQKRLTGGFIQCTSCSTPWIASLCQPRLLGCPKNPRALRGIIRRARTRPGKLTAKEKSLLARYRDRKNAIVVRCLVCRYKKVELFDSPIKEEEEEVRKEGGGSKSRKKKKKKKKRGKEVNAGLLLTTTTTAPKRKRSKKMDASPTSSVFTTSTEAESATRDTPRSMSDTLKNSLGAFRGSSAQPRFKPRAKVLLGLNAAALPRPAPNVLREKKTTVANLKRAMSRESAKGREESKSSLSSFLVSLL